MRDHAAMFGRAVIPGLGEREKFRQTLDLVAGAARRKLCAGQANPLSAPDQKDRGGKGQQSGTL